MDQAGDVDAEMQGVEPDPKVNEVLDGAQETEQDCGMDTDLIKSTASVGVKEVPGPSVFLDQVISLHRSSPPVLPISTRIFRNLSLFIIDLSTNAPSFFFDQYLLWFLAKIVIDPLEVQDLGRKRNLILEDAKPVVDVADDEVCIISEEEMVVKTPCKRRARKLKSPLCEKFVRRSSRINKKLGDFHDQVSADDHQAAKEAGKEAEVEAVMEPIPLEMVPSDALQPQPYVGSALKADAPPPFFSVENAQAIATGNLKMQAGTVSADALNESSDDE
ncbi:unnamed protein product [Urochloa decumbens]|uniref:Uncharacterized protein n=1 Tax=Urochloa decumbens TaxID=240449 RepID=A0ABC9AUF5_9POAL